MILVQTRLI